MSGKRFVLDTSALLAWLEGEDGVERVRELLRGDDEVILPWPVLMELFYITARSSGEQVAFQRYASVKQLPVTLAEQMDEPLLLAAARFKAQFPISIADAMIAAFASHLGATLVHKDPEYDALKGKFAMESLPYKPQAGA